MCQGQNLRGTPNIEHQILILYDYTSHDMFDDQHSRWSTENVDRFLAPDTGWKRACFFEASLVIFQDACASQFIGLLVVVLTLPVFDRRRPIAVQIRMIAAILAQSRKGTSHNLVMNRSSNLNRLVQTCNLFLIQSQRPFMELMATHHGLHIAVCHRFQQLIDDGFTPKAPTVSASSTIWFE
jgi:hypothetical protein